MKQSFLAIAIILLFTQGVYSQWAYPNVTSDDALLKSDSEKIAGIDKMKQEMKINLNSYTKTEKVKDDTGHRYVYTKVKDLQLITVYYKDESNIDKNVEWYFHNGQLFYSEQTWTDRTTKKVVDNEKFYFDNEHLFAALKDDRKINITSQNFKTIAVQMTAYAAKLKADSMK